MKILATKENVKIGSRVIRGIDWKWGNQDRNLITNNSSIGTVTNLPVLLSAHNNDGSTAYWVNVKWDDGEDNSYRIGGGTSNKAFDLYLLSEVTYKIDEKKLEIINSKINIKVNTEDYKKSPQSLIEAILYNLQCLEEEPNIENLYNFTLDTMAQCLIIHDLITDTNGDKK